MPDQRIGRSVSKNAGSTGGTNLTVSPWTLRGVIPALGRTPALRGHPGGIDAAGPGWLSLTAGGDQPDPGPASAPAMIHLAEGGPGTRGGPGTGTEPRAGRRQRIRGARARGPATSRPPTGAGGRSVWQQSMSAWREAGLEWQRLAGWEPADVERAAHRADPGRARDGAAGCGPGRPAIWRVRQAGRVSPRARRAVSRVSPRARRAASRARPPASPARRPRAPGRCRYLRGAARRGGRWHRHHRPAGCRPRPGRAGGGLPVRPSRRCAVRQAERSTRAGSAAHAHRGGRGRPHGGGGGLAGRASLRPPAGPHVARWRPHLAAGRLARPGRREDAADGCRWSRGMAGVGTGRGVDVAGRPLLAARAGRRAAGRWRPRAGAGADTRRVRRRGRERAPGGRRYRAHAGALDVRRRPHLAAPGRGRARPSGRKGAGRPACAGWPRAAAS